MTLILFFFLHQNYCFHDQPKKDPLLFEFRNFQLIFSLNYLDMVLVKLEFHHPVLCFLSVVINWVCWEVKLCALKLMLPQFKHIVMKSGVGQPTLNSQTWHAVTTRKLKIIWYCSWNYRKTISAQLWTFC